MKKVFFRKNFWKLLHEIPQRMPFSSNIQNNLTMKTKTYDPKAVKERIQMIQTEQFPGFTSQNTHAETLDRALRASLAHFGGYTPRDIMKVPITSVEHDGSQLALRELMYITDGVVEGMNVLDLGCGSPIQNRDYAEWAPFAAEMLTELGANIIGVDFRPNPHATYDHRVIDLLRTGREDVVAQLPGNFDLIMAKSIMYGLKGSDNGEGKIVDIIRSLAQPRQLALTDLDVADIGFKPVLVGRTDFFGIPVNTVSYFPEGGRD
jgi:cell wall assembly regulator SMI1